MMRTLRSRFASRSPSTALELVFNDDMGAAPFGTPLQVKVRDLAGAEYSLPFGCERTDRGWFNAGLGTALGKGIEVVGWRRRDFAK